MSLKSAVFSGIKWTAGASALTQIQRFVRLAVLARLLTPEDFGLMGTVQIAVFFVGMFNGLGMANAIVQRKDINERQLSSIFWFNVVLSVILLAILALITPFVADFYSEPRLVNLILLAGAGFILVPLNSQYSVLLTRALRFDVMAKVGVLLAWVSFATVVLLALMGWGVYSLVLGELVSSAVGVGVYVSLGWKQWRPSWHFDRRDLDGFIGFGLYQLGQRIINYTTWNLDKILIGRLVGMEALGYYTVAWNLMQRPLTAINPVVGRVMFPHFARIQDDDARLNQIYLRIIEVLAMIQIPIYIGLFAVAEPLMAVYLGEGWGATTEIFEVLMFLGIVYSLGNPLGTIVLAKGKPEMEFWMNLAGLFIYLGAIWVGAEYGAVGIAMAMLAGGYMLWPVDHFIRWKLTRMSVWGYTAKWMPFAFFAALMLAAVQAADLFLGDSWDLYYRLGLLVTVGAAVYGTCIFIFKRPLLVELRDSLRAKRKAA